MAHVTNALLGRDPSQTAIIRRAAEAEMKRRFAELSRRVRNLVVRDDAFGLRRQTPQLLSQSLNNAELQVTNNRFAFASSQEQFESFVEWFAAQQGETIAPGTSRQSWLGDYIKQAHAKGVQRSLEEYPPRSLLPGSENANLITIALGGPVSTTSAARLISRTFAEMQGLTDQMRQQVGRTLLDGLIAGENPREIARNLATRINVSRSRALAIARTEVIRAQAEGQLDSLEAMGVEQVGVMVEWSTAGDDRVCPMCQPLEGVVMTIKEARGILPRHTNCRCAFIPAFDAPPKRRQFKNRAFRRSLRAERPRARSAAEAGRLSRWPGADRVARRKPLPANVIAAPSPEFWGQQPTAILRWMGKEGWSFEEAQRVFKMRGVKASPNTIRAQLRGGKTGTRGKPALLNDEQAALLRRLREGKVDPPPPPPPVEPPDFGKHSNAALLRWMGREGMDFDQAKAALARAQRGNVADATIRTQLGHGRRLRGKVPVLNDEQAAFLKQGVDTPPLPKPQKPVQPASKASGQKLAPDHIASPYTDDATASPGIKKIWEAIGEGIDSERKAREVGRLIREEAKLRRAKRMADFQASGRTYDAITKEIKALEAKKWEVGGAERAELLKKVGALKKERQRAWNLRAPQNLEWQDLRDVLGDVRHFGGHIDDVTITGDKALVGIMQKEMKDLPSDWIRRIADEMDIETKKVSRGYFRRPQSELGKRKTEIFTSGEDAADEAETMYHELTHASEHANRHARRNALTGKVQAKSMYDLEHDFLIRRAKESTNAADGQLTKIYGDEVGYKDDFFDHYIGKWYGREAFEIMTMGTQHLKYKILHILDDTDYVDFVLGLMGGL